MSGAGQSTAVIEKDALNSRQRLFLTAYLADNKRNATQAAIAAGYSPKTAGQQGFALLKHPQILLEVSRANAAFQQEQKQIVAEVIDRFVLDRSKVLRQVAIGAHADMRGFYDEQGNLIPPHKLTYEQSCLIEGIENIPVYEGIGQERRQCGWTVKYKIAKRHPYVDMAMKHLGEYKKDNEQAGKAFVGSLAELANGMKGSTLPIARVERVDSALRIGQGD